MAKSNIQTVGVYIELDIDTYDRITCAGRTEIALNVSQALLAQAKSSLAHEGGFVEEARVRVGATNMVVNPMHDTIKCK